MSSSAVGDAPMTQPRAAGIGAMTFGLATMSLGAPLDVGMDPPGKRAASAEPEGVPPPKRTRRTWRTDRPTRPFDEVRAELLRQQADPDSTRFNDRRIALRKTLVDAGACDSALSGALSNAAELKSLLAAFTAQSKKPLGLQRPTIQAVLPCTCPPDRACTWRLTRPALRAIPPLARGPRAGGSATDVKDRLGQVMRAIGQRPQTLALLVQTAQELYAIVARTLPQMCTDWRMHTTRLPSGVRSRPDEAGRQDTLRAAITHPLMVIRNMEDGWPQVVWQELVGWQVALGSPSAHTVAFARRLCARGRAQSVFAPHANNTLAQIQAQVARLEMLPFSAVAELAAPYVARRPLVYVPERIVALHRWAQSNLNQVPADRVAERIAARMARLARLFAVVDATIDQQITAYGVPIEILRRPTDLIVVPGSDEEALGRYIATANLEFDQYVRDDTAYGYTSQLVRPNPARLQQLRALMVNELPAAALDLFDRVHATFIGRKMLATLADVVLDGYRPTVALHYVWPDHERALRAFVDGAPQ